MRFWLETFNPFGCSFMARKMINTIAPDAGKFCPKRINMIMRVPAPHTPLLIASILLPFGLFFVALIVMEMRQSELVPQSPVLVESGIPIKSNQTRPDSLALIPKLLEQKLAAIDQSLPDDSQWRENLKRKVEVLYGAIKLAWIRLAVGDRAGAVAIIQPTSAIFVKLLNQMEKRAIKNRMKKEDEVEELCYHSGLPSLLPILEELDADVELEAVVKASLKLNKAFFRQRVTCFDYRSLSSAIDDPRYAEAAWQMTMRMDLDSVFIAPDHQSFKTIMTDDRLKIAFQLDQMNEKQFQRLLRDNAIRQKPRDQAASTAAMAIVAARTGRSDIARRLLARAEKLYPYDDELTGQAKPRENLYYNRGSTEGFTGRDALTNRVHALVAIGDIDAARNLLLPADFFSKTGGPSIEERRLMKFDRTVLLGRLLARYGRSQEALSTLESAAPMWRNAAPDWLKDEDPLTMLRLLGIEAALARRQHNLASDWLMRFGPQMKDQGILYHGKLNNYVRYIIYHTCRLPNNSPVKGLVDLLKYRTFEPTDELLIYPNMARYAAVCRVNGNHELAELLLARRAPTTDPDPFGSDWVQAYKSGLND